MLRFWVLGASFSSPGCFVFESWVLRFRVLGASFSSLGCFVFEFRVLRFRFRDLGASCFGLRFRVLRFRNYIDSFLVWILLTSCENQQYVSTAITNKQRREISHLQYIFVSRQVCRNRLLIHGKLYQCTLKTELLKQRPSSLASKNICVDPFRL